MEELERHIYNPNTYDSMNMSVFVSDGIYGWTPEKLIKVLFDISRSLTSISGLRLDNEMQASIQKAINSIIEDTSFQNNCKFIWKYEADSYATSLNNTLRELRSDLIMVTILNMSLEKYLKLMISEPNWADRDDVSTADSVIMRIGLISRLLYNKDINGTMSFPNSDQNFAWIEKCENILSNLQQSTSDDRTKRHIGNIRSYLKAYSQISIEESDRRYISKGCSLLETSLSPLIKQWKTEGEMYRDLPIVQKICLASGCRHTSLCTESFGNVSEEGLIGNCVDDQIELLSRSFPEMHSDMSDVCRARVLEKHTVPLYRALPIITYVENLDCRNYRGIYENSFSHTRDRMDECGRISLASMRRKG